MAKVELNGIRKVYKGDVVAIGNANVTVEDKEFVVLVGPSGCGKSTLLRMIAGLEEITGGDLLIDGARVNDISPKDRNIAMVFQNYALYPHMTVFDNMAFGLKLRKFPKKEIKRRVEETSEILGLHEFLHRRPKEMSGGQRQRVAIGRAIVRQPKVFLFDEPLSNLDAKLRVQMRMEIKRLHKSLQATMIYVTHDQIEAMTLGDKIVVLKDGAVQQIDSPMNLYNNPANRFVAGFIGSPAMNFINGRIAEGQELQFVAEGIQFGIPGELGLREKLRPFAGKEVIFGFRPEYMYDKKQEREKQLSVDLNIVIDTIEMIGSESFNYFYFQGNPERSFCFRGSSEHRYESGQEVKVGVDVKRLLFFDRATEHRI